MRAVVVYESMFGNTRAIAEAIAEGIGTEARVTVVRVGHADASLLNDADLVVVGGPTHVRGMSRASTRKGAPSYVAKPDSDLVLEPGADTEPGVREWLAKLGRLQIGGAAFDTRVKAPALLTGRASKGIGRALSDHGVTMVLGPESFLVNREGHLLPGEMDRARAWGRVLGSTVQTTQAGTSRLEHPQP
jgi:hypothetical protein